VPAEGSLNTDGLDCSRADLAKLLAVDPAEVAAQLPQVEAHLAQFGDRLPDEIKRQLEGLKERLNAD
jgi:phosphoenolpyruvate carboxykinase (GTP)